MPTATEHHKKTLADRISNGVHHLGEMLSIPMYEALDTYHPDPHREQHQAANQPQSATMHKIAHTAGQLVSIPKQEAIDACANAGNRQHHSSSHTPEHDHHDRKSLSERIGSGVHHMGEMLSVPTYEAIDACAHVPHRSDARPRVQKSQNVKNMCHTMGALLSVPICETAEACGGGRRGH